MRQAFFLTDPRRESLYGGSAGGGKSDALLMGGLQYVDHPEYAGLLLRRTYAELALPGAIMDRAHDWLGGTAAHWDDDEKTYTFPSGGTLTFGYLQYERDKYRYQGSNYLFVGFDELTGFMESQYRYLFSRLRRAAGSQVPVRMRAASNPGGEGHDWVFERFFVRGPGEGRGFVPARLGDNPHLDQAEYVQSLAELDPLTRQQLLDGLWVVDPTRRPFRRAWWRNQHRYDATDERLRLGGTLARWLTWDTAFKDQKDSAYTAFGVLELTPDYRLRLRHVWREKLIFPDLVAVMEREIAAGAADDKLRGVIIEDKATGTSAYQTLLGALKPALADLLIPFSPQGSKEQRAAQAAVWCKLGCVDLPHPSEAVPWLLPFTSELFAFPDTQYADQVDMFSQGLLFLEHYLAEGYHARGGEAAA